MLEETIIKLDNLEREIEKLNASETITDEDGELTLDSFYKFKYRIDGDAIIIYDSNEYFNIDLDEEIRCIVHDACLEFGAKYKTPESTVERIIDIFQKALEADLNKKDIVIEWQDSFCLVAYID